MSTPAEAWMVSIAVRLGELRERVMFLGGAVLGLLGRRAQRRPTDRGRRRRHRPTLAGRPRRARRAALLALGFHPESLGGRANISRYLGDLKLDIMPTDAAILGFSNRWYAEALATATPREVAPGVRVKVVGAPYFVATKLEAFFSRGGADFMASHDLEDIIAVVDGRDALIDEVRAASPDCVATSPPRSSACWRPRPSSRRCRGTSRATRRARRACPSCCNASAPSRRPNATRGSARRKQPSSTRPTGRTRYAWPTRAIRSSR